MKRIFYTIIALLLICTGVSVQASAETRNIYVGDIITLEITSQDVSQDDLRQQFQDFEIIELHEEPDGYSLSIRTFTPGEYTIIVGDTEIVISVTSTLDDIQRDDIFEADANVIQPEFTLQWRILLVITAGVFTISASLMLIKLIRKGTHKPETPYERFLKQSANLSPGDNNYFVDLTLLFKVYIESVCQCAIIGKTTSEITDALNGTDMIKDFLPDIQEWLITCDGYKFTGMTVSDEAKHHHYELLLSLVKHIEENRTDINEVVT